MSIKSERSRTVIALLSAACTLLVQAEGEGSNERALLKASFKAREIITREMDRQLENYDKERAKLSA